MADCLYLCLQDDDKIARFEIDPATGGLTRQADVPVAGGPSVTALSPDRRVLYVGLRTRPAISSLRIDPATGALTPQGTVASGDAPTFLATDRAGRFLLSAYYQGGYAAVHPLGSDGAIGAPALDRYDTANGAHAIATDPSNRFAFVPHIARLQDNVLEPPKNNPGPNFIAQFRFDAESGRLTPNSPFGVDPAGNFLFAAGTATGKLASYRIDGETGALTPLATQSVGQRPAAVQAVRVGA